MLIRLPSGSVLDDDPDIDQINRVIAADSLLVGLVASNGEWYWAGDEADRWDDPGLSEKPKVFRSLTRCKARCERQGPGWRPMVWVSADIDIPAIERYVKMDGHRYPTSPRQ